MKYLSTLVFYAQLISTIIQGREQDVKGGMYSQFSSRKAVSAIVNIIPEKLSNRSRVDVSQKCYPSRRSNQIEEPLTSVSSRKSGVLPNCQ